MENYNQYVAKLVEKQMDANMQRHLKDFGKKEYYEEQNEEDLPIYIELSLFTFLNSVVGKLYYRDKIIIEEHNIATAINHINEKCLSDNNFSKALKGELKEFSNDLENFDVSLDNGITSNIVISYLPSIDENTSNILRFSITEKSLQGDAKNCSIDFKSDGTININNQNNQKFYFNYDVLEEIEDYLMNVYELADLKTNSVHK